MKTQFTKHETEVLNFLMDNNKYPLSKRVYKTGVLKGLPYEYAKHSRAFEKLRSRGMTGLNSYRVWVITIKGIKAINKITGS